MNLRTETREEPEVNLTSLIDVVLLLLIFFMVSTSFVRESELTVELPEASSEPFTADTQLEITITEQGEYYVDKQALVNKLPQTLRRALEMRAGERRDVAVTIRADGRADHQSVVTAMDVVGRLGFSQINIATVNLQDGS